MTDNEVGNATCRSAEIRLMLCCELFGAMEAMRIFRYAQALRDNCAVQVAAGRNRSPC